MTDLNAIAPWQKKFPFALGNYFWNSPSGKRLLVFKEWNGWRAERVEKFSQLKVESTFRIASYQKWEAALLNIKGQRYPVDQIHACEELAQLVRESFWSENETRELDHYFLAAFTLLECEQKLATISELDFELFMLFSFRATMIFLFELLFSSRNYQFAFLSACRYIAFCQEITLSELDYDLSCSLKHNQDNPRETHRELFKKLGHKELGAWNELAHADIFFYAANTITPAWLYPEGRISLKQLLIQAMSDSGLSQGEEFVQKYEQYLLGEGESAA